MNMVMAVDLVIETTQQYKLAVCNYGETVATYRGAEAPFLVSVHSAAAICCNSDLLAVFQSSEASPHAQSNLTLI